VVASRGLIKWSDTKLLHACIRANGMKPHRVSALLHLRTRWNLKILYSPRSSWRWTGISALSALKTLSELILSAAYPPVFIPKSLT
jgi:hypothetical protein